VVPDDREQALQDLERVRAGESFVHEFRIRRHSDGVFRWIRSTDFPLYDHSSKVIRIAGIGRDVTEEKLSTEHQAILLAELQHRVRNIMAMIRSVANRTRRSAASVDDYAGLISGRIMSLARTQSLLTRAANANVEIAEIVQTELEALAQDGSHYRVSGPELKISPKAAEVLSLAIHELATNALKYGALAVADGLVSVQWQVVEENERQWLNLLWSETRPPVPGWTPPSRRGFGTELVERRVPYELHGRGRVEITPQGAQVFIEFPLGSGASILETGAPMRKSVFGGSIDMSGEPSLAGARILILEDDYMLATDAESALSDVGAKVIGPFSMEAEAIAAVRQGNLNAAMIDINLGNGASFETAQALRRAETPFVFVTGYDESSIPAELADVPRFVKPVDLRQIVRALVRLRRDA
jgi:two-component sensor histidine kinase